MAGSRGAETCQNGFLGMVRGGSKEGPRRRQGGNGALAAPPYEVRSTTNEVSEALTRRWAVGPAIFVDCDSRCCSCDS